MPQIWDPLKTQVGGRTSRKRKTRPSPNTSASANEQRKASMNNLAIGEDLLDFLGEDHNKPTNKRGSNRTIKVQSNNNKAKIKRTTGTKPVASSAKKVGTTTTSSTKKGGKAATTKTTSKNQFEPNETRKFSSNKASEETSPSSSSLSQKALLQNPRSIAFDTRCINTEEGCRESNTFLKQCHNFLQSLDRRGLSPSYVSCTELHRPVSKERTKVNQPNITLRIRTEKVAVSDKIYDALLSSSAPQRTIPSSKSGGDEDKSPIVKVPPTLTGHASWKLFADFVDSILQEHKGKLSVQETAYEAQDIAIITNGFSFLADTNEASHKEGMDEFWNRVKPYFLNSKLRRVQIVFARTNSIVVDDDEADENSNNIDLEEKENLDNGQPENATQRIERLVRQRETAVEDCLSVLQKHLSEKAEEEYKANRSYIQFGSKLIPSVNINIIAIDSTCLGFMSVLRQWSRETLAGSYRLSLELPETLAFERCSLSLEAMYKIMPLSLISQHARAAMKDLTCLSRSMMKVSKLVPIASIDASLLYGIPIEVRPALENDITQHNQMKLLARSLFKTLSARDCALLLHASYPMDENFANDGLFHSVEETFLLMPEELPSALKGRNATTIGLLYRIAVADHLIADAEIDDVLARTEEDDVSEAALSEYIDSCIDSLECSSINPLYTAATKTGFRSLVTTAKNDEKFLSESHVAEEAPREQTSLECREGKICMADANIAGDASSGFENDAKASSHKDKNAWNDSSGVGSRVRFNQDSEDESTGQISKRKKGPIRKKYRKEVAPKQIRKTNDLYDTSSDESVSARQSPKILRTASAGINNDARKRMVSKLVSTVVATKDASSSDHEEWSDDLGDFCGSDSESS